MPELPDVEVGRRHIAATVLKRPIAGLSVRDPKLLEDTTRQKLSANFVGSSFLTTERRGKLLGIASESSGCLLLHFGMTGWVRCVKPDEDQPDAVALRVEFDDGRALCFQNQRRFGMIGWTRRFDDAIDAKQLGPDALTLDREELASILSSARGAVKPLLMNQQRIAGIGNLYSDEILFHAGIAPNRDAASLDQRDIQRIHTQLHRVLDKAIEKDANPREMPDSWIVHRREDGANCPRCKGRVRGVSVGGRTGYWCPECQR